MADEKALETTERPAGETVTEIADDAAQADEPKSYDADFVNGIKQEAVDNRQKAKALAIRLHTELVRQNGRLADPTELAFDATHLDDPEALTAAIDELLSRKPHYAARTPHGNVGQGAKDQGEPPFNLVSHLKGLV
jgi:hypothetical protein